MKMKLSPILSLSAFTLACLCSNAVAAETTYTGIPLKPDPPPSIDGRLDEWAAVPNTHVLNTKEHAVFGGHTWKSPEDLSAKLWLAWRQEYLYLAADVTDDRVVQKAQSKAMWQGDHIEFYLDVAPDFETERDMMGVGQLQLGLSPGNFEKTGDPTIDKAPEAVVFRPQDATGEGILVAAQRTPQGYILEAAIPWPLISKLTGRELGTPAAGLPVSVEIAVSDTDSDEPQQEKIIALQTGAWEHGQRSRWMPAVLAPTDGVALPVQQKAKLFDTIELAPSGKQEIRFQAEAVPAGKEAILSLKTRIDYKEVGGYSQALGLTLNGVPLDAKRLRNRREVEELKSGRTLPAFGNGRFSAPYAPDFEAIDKHAEYAARNAKISMSLIEVDVTDLLKVGENVLVLDSEARETPIKTIAAQGRLEFRAPYVPPVKRAAPTGPLEIHQPDALQKVNYSLKEQVNGLIELRQGQSVYNVTSQFSAPDGTWQQGSNKYFTHKRTIKQQNEAIIVQDTFVNLTDENLPLMQQHRVNFPPPGQDDKAAGNLRKVWLAGLSPSTLNGTASDSGNPTSYGVSANGGVGLMPLDDVSQVHVTTFSAENMVGWADNQCVLRPRATHVSEWAILPTGQPDYYQFVNAARRLREVNFTIDGSFAFFFAFPGRGSSNWSDKQFTDFLRFKNAKFACNGQIPYHPVNGLTAQGTASMQVDWTFQKATIARLRKLVPESQYTTYFHCFIDVAPEAPEKYADARTLRADGAQADYGNPGYKIFVPTETNAFGRDIAKNIDFYLAPQPAGLGVDGIYWDELEYSAARYHYDDFNKPKAGLPWDGVSGDIDPQTKKITALKSSVTLLSQPYRLALAKRVMAKGPLIGNGAPHTRSMMQLHFPRFVETGSISNCALSQLYTPIALGDHLTEKNELDAYRWMVKALDYACLYYWYSEAAVMPTHPTLTSYMFPLTPIELHPGTIIGKERIVTNRSGLFGWGDNAQHEVHVFNDEGKEVKDFKAPTITRDGKTFTELRLAEDWSAAIVRK